MTFLEFVLKRGGVDQFTFAIVSVAVSDTLANINSEDLRTRLTMAVSAWVCNSQEGRNWYELSASRDANIADLGTHGVTDELRELLEVVGIHKLAIKLYHDEACSSMTYDTCLVDESLIDDDRASNHGQD